jgi:hypothetical protein
MEDETISLRCLAAWRLCVEKRNAGGGGFGGRLPCRNDSKTAEFVVEIGHGVWYQEGARIQGPGARERSAVSYQLLVVSYQLSVFSVPKHREDARCRPTSSFIVHPSAFILLPFPRSLLPMQHPELATLHNKWFANDQP